MEVQINIFLQQFSNNFLDKLNLLITNIGDEIFFLVVAMVVFWCVDKRFGFKLINVYLLGCIVMSAMKNIVRRPRPFEETRVQSIGERESGYSFPSGHSHSIANLSTQAAMKTKKIWVILLGVALTLAVMFTRLYLGQHYLTDVIAGCGLGIITAITFGAIYDLLSRYDDKFWYVIMPLCVVVAAVCIIANVDNGQIYDVCGGYGAAVIGYTIEKKYIKLDVKASWQKQIIKVLLGAAVVLLLKEGLKAVFVATGLTHPAIYNFLRYAVVALAAFALMPWIFKKLHLYGDSRKIKEVNKSESSYKKEKSH